MCYNASGEDSIWLKAIRKAGLTVYVSKETIGKVSYETSSWFTGYDEKYFYGIGACYQAINPKTAALKRIIRVYKERGRGELTNKQKSKWIKNGMKGYKNMMSYQELASRYPN